MIAGSFSPIARSRRLAGTAGRAVPFAAALVAWLGGAPAARAGWSVEQIAKPVGLPNGALSAVSCPSARSCIAVGGQTDASGRAGPLVERWNGARWTREPSLGAGASLTAVSCASADACMAIESATSPAVRLLSGGRWSVERVPVPGGDTRAQLTGVSCPSAKICDVVGSALTAQGPQPLVVRWAGGRWRSQPVPLLAVADGGGLSGVSCASRTACIAVGHMFGGSGEFTLAEAWNGSRWAITGAPASISSGFQLGDLTAVSCTASTACTAVGGAVSPGYFPSGLNSATIVERWNGTAWSVQEVPAGSVADLVAVSCGSARRCTAVEGSGSPAAVVWSGGSWSVTPLPPARDGSLTGVSCPSARSCMVVGSSLGSGGMRLNLAEHQTGVRWSAQRPPAVDGPTSVNPSAISCATAASCVATGTYGDGSNRTRMLAERWTAAGWSLQPTPVLVGRPYVNMTGVSCSAPSACMTVGSDTESGFTASQFGLVERWDGSRWSLDDIPAPAGAAGVDLGGVSCTAPAACTVVGYAIDEPGARLVPVVDRWNGRRWSAQGTPAAPNPAGLSYLPVSLTGVACTSSTLCTAVGAGWGTLAERWNGVAWSIQPTPYPPGGAGYTLTAVSCPARFACTALGRYGGSVPFVERWNGTGWSLQQLPALPDGSFYLTAISCGSPTSCTAVGEALSGTLRHAAPAALHWNGRRWAIQRVFHVAEEGLEDAAIGCPSASTCTAIWSYLGTRGQGTLVPR
jgi:hypothetical protein